MKKILFASALSALFVGCSSLSTTTQTPIQPTKAIEINQVLGTGLTNTAVLLEYPQAIRQSQIQKQNIEVENRHIIKIYPSDKAGHKVAKSSQVMVELDPTDSTATRIIRNVPAQQLNQTTATGQTKNIGKAGDKKEDGPCQDTTPINLTVNGQALQTSATQNQIADQFKQLSFYDSKTGKTLKYNLFIPSHYDKNKSYPLVLFMHDAGVTGSNINSTLIQGNGAISFASPEAQAKHPVFVLAPQYDEIIADDDSKNSDYLDTTIHLIEQLQTQYAINPHKLYATGQSGGAMTTIAMNIKYPNLFAASWIVAGQWDSTLVAPMAKNKLFVMVSENDAKAFPIENAIMQQLAENGATIQTLHGLNGSDSVAQLNQHINQLLSKPANVYYATFTGGTLPLEKNATSKGSAHMGTWKVAYNITAIQDWLFKQQKTD